jgi:hypothetical protein
MEFDQTVQFGEVSAAGILAPSCPDHHKAPIAYTQRINNQTMYH